MLFRSKGDKALSFFIMSVLAVFFVIVSYPLWFVLIASISNPSLVALNKIWLYPREIMFEGYANVFKNNDIWIGYGNSFFYAFFGTVINLAATLTCAFCMARKPDFKGKNFVLVMLVFTMYFSGGLIPSYILIRNLGMLDTRAVLIIPGALSVYHMIVARTFFQNTIPDSLYESAKIEGCGDIRMYTQITLPLSKAIVAVLTLFFVVGHWNAFFSALIYVQSLNKQPLQLVLRRILILGEVMANMGMSSMRAEEMEYWVQRQAMAESMKYAVIYIASLPLLIAYPFVQKYFVQGVMIGAIKG